jgi:hypothetical protein
MLLVISVSGAFSEQEMGTLIPQELLKMAKE